MLNAEDGTTVQLFFILQLLTGINLTTQATPALIEGLWQEWGEIAQNHPRQGWLCNGHLARKDSPGVGGDFGAE